MKLRPWQQILIIIIGILLSAGLAHGEKKYISDTLIISLRNTPSLQGEVVAYLKSGDPLEIIEENEEGFLYVQTVSGEQGWLQKKYTIDEKPKDMIIAELTAKIRNLEASLAPASALRQQLTDREMEIGRQRDEITDLKKAVENAQTSYEDLRGKSTGVQEAFAERDKLEARVEALNQEVARLKIENAELVQTERILWFLAGFGVFLVGWVMGKYARRSRRSGISL